MDQKNTIVKCKAHPNCLFNHNGICDNYVITIGADGKCDCYVETARVDNFEISEIEEIAIYKPGSKEPLLVLKEPQKGQRAKCSFIEDSSYNLCSAACHNYDFKGASLYCQLRQEYLGPERLMKPCDLFAKAENDKVTVKMKVAELDNPNKNLSVITDWDYASTPDICKTCKKVVYGHYCKYKDVANGVWAYYERDESIKRAGALNECWWCDFFNSEKRSCKHKDPDIDRYGCHSSQSTGGNR